MNAVTPPRSAHVEALIIRTQHVAMYLPAIDTADASLFPPPYVDDAIGKRMVRLLHEPAPETRVHPLLSFAVWCALSASTGVVVYGALSFFLWALSLLGRPA